MFSRNMKTNRNVAFLVTGFLALGNILQFLGTNLYASIPFGVTVLPLLSTLGLAWVAAAIWKHKV